MIVLMSSVIGPVSRTRTEPVGSVSRKATDHKDSLELTLLVLTQAMSDHQTSESTTYDHVVVSLVLDG